MARRFGLGLRAQIVLALSAAFVLSFALLGVAVVQLAERARALDRIRAAEDTARIVAAEVPGMPGERRDAVARLADEALEGRLVAGVSVEWAGLEPHARGLVGVGPAVEAPLADGSGTVRVWARPLAQGDSAPLANLVLLYVATTGGAILLLAFVSLTYLIVRPVEAVTRASERLALGDMRVEVPVRGAAEVARLAVAFNAMAAQLRAERHALEERVRALERTTAELAAARDHLVRSEKLASVGRLSAGVAHEIGNPLAAILGLVELLRDDDGHGVGLDRRELLGRVHRETERIQKTIRDLLDFARQERDAADDTPDHDVTTDLEGLVDDAIRLVEPQKSLRDVAIERAVARPLPRVRGARDRITQVVVNLLLNAADAVEGRGRVRVSLAVEPSGVVRLDVEDDGPGIAPAVADHLFEPFVTTKPTGKGTGLGLAVCHTLVERMGGSLEAGASTLGGARFTVRLRAA